MDVDGEVWDRDSYSDDSPVLSHRYEKRRRAPHIREGEEEIERRSTLSTLAKFFLFSSAMILFCVLMYVPVYNKANYQMQKATVKGWSMHTNRDPKVYVLPNNVTTIHEPKDVCAKEDGQKNKLYLLIVVYSSTVNFERRQTIRETWGNYENYLKHSKVFKDVREKYKTYNYTQDLYPNASEKIKLVSNVTNSSIASGENNFTLAKISKRDLNSIHGFIQLLPELAKAIKLNLATAKTAEDEAKSDEEKSSNLEDEPVLPEFDMNDVIGDEKNTAEYNYDYESNIMKIPPKGEEGANSEENNIYGFLPRKQFNLLDVSNGNTEKEFKLVFLLGLPANDNNSKIQNAIEDEVTRYGDVLQDGFIDSYNNLTLKSIMMLKWVTNRCNESVRYILKSDDDMYINLPNLMQNLRNRSRVFDENVANKGQKEYLLIGSLISGARPLLDPNNKWYSPRYMYGGRVYPRYLSGTAYALSSPAAAALYRAALTTTFFHLEDIYITGLCALRSSPRVQPRHEPLFTYRAASGHLPCWVHARASTHHITSLQMRAVSDALANHTEVDRCERIRLTQVRRDRMRPKPTSKKNLKTP